MFIIFGGLPGVGKSTIARLLARKLKAVYLRIDSIEQAIKDADKTNNANKRIIISEGYITAYAVAKDNLEIGLTVIADSVNPLEITRNDYKKVATDLNIAYFEIEVICSDMMAHKERVQTRTSSTKGLRLPTWQDVVDREYQIWRTKSMTIDTASISEIEAVDSIVQKLIKID